MNFFRNVNLSFLSVGFVCLAFLIYTFVHFTDRKPPVQMRTPTQASLQPTVEFGESWTPQDENNALQIAALVESGLEKRTNGIKPMKRDAHPKHHGCVYARLETLPSELPENQRVGIFSPDQPTKFDAWVRFSNGDPDSSKPDAEGDVRGMAIKLMNVLHSATGVQDFLMMNSKSFFIKDTEEYLDLMNALNSKFAFAIIKFAVFHSRFREVLNAAKEMKVGNPLDVDYFSATPYKLGNTAVKWAMKSCVPDQNKSAVPTNPSPDFLGEILANSLEKNEACFELQVQLHNPNALMPIEDPTVEWSENQSKYFTIGKLTIPVQNNVRSAAQMSFCENLSFNPWKTLPEQRPLGAINRVRLQTYKAISEKRHLFNQLPMLEPKSIHACEGDIKIFCVD